MEADDKMNMSWRGYLADQIEAEQLVRSTWGDKSMDDPHERGMRVAEEALETLQVLKGTRAEAHALVDMVFDKPLGEIDNEIGGVLFTLMTLCANLGKRFDTLYAKEIARFKSKDPKFFRAKQKIKADLGLSARVE